MVMSRQSVHLSTLFLGKLDISSYNHYFVHILSLVTVNSQILNQWKEEYDRINYFMINVQESMGLGRD